MRSFLAARGITLSEGDPDDEPSAETAHGLGNRKNELFQQTIQRRATQHGLDATGAGLLDGSKRPQIGRGPHEARAIPR